MKWIYFLFKTFAREFVIEQWISYWNSVSKFKMTKREFEFAMDGPCPAIIRILTCHVIQIIECIY